jgi:chromosome transmission fidelity protein 1
MVPLGSRKQLCINDKVRALAKGGSDERMNEACLDMQKSGQLDDCMRKVDRAEVVIGKTRCEYLPGKGEEGKMVDARDSILATVKDIEDIVTSGKKACVCPYYSTRKAVKQAQVDPRHYSHASDTPLICLAGYATV